MNRRIDTASPTGEGKGFLLATLAAAIWFGLVFLCYPLHDSLPGNIDLWFYVWQLGDVYARFTGQAVFGQILYPFPAEDLSALVGSPLGNSLLYIPIRWLTGDVIWSFYLLIVALLSLNSGAFYLLARRIGAASVPAMVCALLFTATNFSMSNLENLNAFTVFPALLALYSLMRVQKATGSRKWAWWAAAGLFAAGQLYYSLYIFGFLLVCMGLLGLIFQPSERWGLAGILFFIAWTVLLTLPFFLDHRVVPAYLGECEVLKQMVRTNEYHSLAWPSDLLRVHPGNLLYPSMSDIENPWRYGARSGFFGIAALLMFAAACRSLWRRRAFRFLGTALVLIAVFSLMSTGPMIRTPWFEWNTPVGWINQWMPGTATFRHLFRAHFVSIIVLFAVIAYADPFRRIRSRRVWIAAWLGFLAVSALENLPLKASIYPSQAVLEEGRRVGLALEPLPDRSRLMFLPGCGTVADESELALPFNPVNREYIYAVWKIRLPFDISNGMLAHFTDHAFKNQADLCHPDTVSLHRLIDANDTDYIIWLPHMAMNREKEWGRVLESTCEPVVLGERFTIYRPSVPDSNCISR